MSSSDVHVEIHNDATATTGAGITDAPVPDSKTAANDSDVSDEDEDDNIKGSIKKTKPEPNDYNYDSAEDQDEVCVHPRIEFTAVYSNLCGLSPIKFIQH